MRIDKIIVGKTPDGYDAAVYALGEDPLFRVQTDEVEMNGSAIELPTGGEAHFDPSGGDWDIRRARRMNADTERLVIEEQDVNLPIIPVEKI